MSELIAEKGIIGMVLGGTVLGQLVLVSLLFLSVLSWAIILGKSRQLKRLDQNNQLFWSIFEPDLRMKEIGQQLKDLPSSPFREIFQRTYSEAVESTRRANEKSIGKAMLPHITVRLQRITDRSILEQGALLESRLSSLATISSASPFIGLFGTVMGIIDSFQSIGTTGVTSLAAVAPGISEALIATAAGLLAAIPALMGYNHFRNRTRLLGNSMRDFGSELSNRLEWILHEQFAASRERQPQ